MTKKLMQNKLFLVVDWLISAGVILLVMSFVPVRAIIQQLPAGNARTRWKILSGLIFMFLAGYVLYIFHIFFQTSGTITPLADFIVPWIFFGGAIFVFMVCSLSLKTALDLRQLYILEQETITDPLMGIYNRRYLDRRLAEEVQRARRYALPFSIFLLDIDFFKNINDTYGHQMGDMILKKLALVIVDSVRELDVVIRYGGEEILVILPNTRVENAVELAERLRQRIEDMRIGMAPEKERPQGMDAPREVPMGSEKRSVIQVTVSIGIAGYRFSGDAETAHRVVERADKALYQAKEQGRNRVVSS